MLRVAIDMDGTFNRYPDYFVELALGLQSRGAEVGILTARIADSSRTIDLSALRDKGWRPDFYYGRGQDERDLDPMTWKAAQMEAHKIDFLYDDFQSNVIRLFWRQDLVKNAPKYGDPSKVKNKKNKKLKPNYSGANTPDTYR